jgi:hypothetical protein
LPHSVLASDISEFHAPVLTPELKTEDCPARYTICTVVKEIFYSSYPDLSITPRIHQTILPVVRCAEPSKS